MKKIHLTILLFVIAIILYFMKEFGGLSDSEEILQQKINKISGIGKAIDRCLNDFGFSQDWIKNKTVKEGQDNIGTNLKLVRVPKDLPLSVLNLAIKEVVEDSGGTVLSGVEVSVDNSLILTIGYENTVIDSIILTKDEKLTHKKGKIGLIIDDFGNNKSENLEGYINLLEKITISIIPGSKYAKEIGEIALKSGKEVMIHLPMESYEPTGKNENILLKSNSKKNDVEKLISISTKELPMAKGVSNHTGSKVTEDATVMKSLADVLRKKNLYFIDSRTTEKSKAYEVFKKSKNRVLKRDVFLDHIETEEFIKAQIDTLIMLAKKQGMAIGIGHQTKEITYRILQREIPRIKKKGYEFVYISEMLEK